MIMDFLIFDVETKQKTTITFNLVTVILYLTHLLYILLLFENGLGGGGGGGGGQRRIFCWHMFNKDQLYCTDILNNIYLSQF